MSLDPEFARLLQAEKAAEAARLNAHRQEARRCAGVAWSGLGPDPFVSREPAGLRRAVDARLAALGDWRSSRRGRLLSAMVAAERAVEALRAGLTRGLALDDRRCVTALSDLAHAARTAMDAAAPGSLSEAPCATNIASSSRSTTSPTSSRG